MAVKAAFSLLNGATVTSSTIGFTDVEVDLSAFASAQLFADAASGNPATLSYDLQELDPVTGVPTGGQPLGASQNISAGSIQRFQFAVPSIRYRIRAYSQGASGLLSVTLVATA
jgi:hypothetical protein